MIVDMTDSQPTESDRLARIEEKLDQLIIDVAALKRDLAVQLRPRPDLSSSYRS